MERYADGDAQAFDALLRLLEGPLRGCLRRWLKADQVDDAFQNTLMKVHRSRARYRKGAPVLPWVLTIARNEARDRLRSRTRREQSFEEGELERLPAVTSETEWREEDEAAVIEAVRAAVEQLPASSRAVVRLHKIEGRTMAEVAEILGINEGAARVRAHRGYKALIGLLTGVRSQR